MSKNHRIEAKVSQDTKNAILKKAESYGGITGFLEAMAKFDIVILDNNTSKLIKELMKNNGR